MWVSFELESRLIIDFIIGPRKQYVADALKGWWRCSYLTVNLKTSGLSKVCLNGWPAKTRCGTGGITENFHIWMPELIDQFVRN